MAIQDNVVEWYIRNIIIPNFVKYDNPGFVITEQDTKYGHTYQRDLFLSERFLADLETKFVQKYGEQGKLFLYGVGKNFGWNYGKSFNMPTIKTNSKKEVVEMASFLARFVGGTWAERSQIIKIDADTKYFEIGLTDFVVCSINGLGHMLTEGGIAGLWAWLMADYTIEGIQTKCEGKKQNECVSVSAPPEFFKKQKQTFTEFSEKIETNSSTQEYITYNKIRPTRFSFTSMKKLITNNIVTYSKGKMEYNKERYFPLGIDFLFLLESQAKKLPNGSQLLFDTAFEHGYRIANNEKELVPKFMSDFMALQGWGDLSITNSLQDIGITYYPWHELINQSGKEVFLGFLSGMVSACAKRTIKLKISGSSNSQGFVTYNLEAVK